MRSVYLLFFLFLCLFVNAESSVSSVMDSTSAKLESQPGYAVLSSFNKSLALGKNEQDAANDTLQRIKSGTISLSPGVSEVLLNNTALSSVMLSHILSERSLFDATKSTIEMYPENAKDIITLAVTLYPSMAQKIVNSAVLTGEIDSEQALIAAIYAGADPSEVSSATAAGPSDSDTIEAVDLPLGAGLNTTADQINESQAKK